MQKKRNLFRCLKGIHNDPETNLQRMIAKMDVFKGYLSINYDKLILKQNHFYDCKDVLGDFVDLLKCLFYFRKNTPLYFLK